MSFNMISIDGIDKSGKGIVFKYLQYLGDHQHVLLDRGPLSNYMFSKMYNRGFAYDIKSFKNVLFVLLHVDYEDWKARCAMSNEPRISWEQHNAAYADAAREFAENGCTVIEYNTSKLTPYEIAKDIISTFNANNSNCARLNA